MWRHQQGRFALQQEWGIAERQLDVLRFTPPFSGNTFLVVLVLVFLSLGMVPASFVLWFCLGIFFVSTCLRLGHMEQLSLDHQQPIATAPAGPFALSYLRSTPLSGGGAMLLLSPGHGLLLMDQDWAAAGGGVLFHSSQQRSNRLTDSDFAQLSTHVHSSSCQHRSIDISSCCGLSKDISSRSPAGFEQQASVHADQLQTGQAAPWHQLDVGQGTSDLRDQEHNSQHCCPQQVSHSSAHAYQQLATAYGSSHSISWNDGMLGLQGISAVPCLQQHPSAQHSVWPDGLAAATAAEAMSSPDTAGHGDADSHYTVPIWEAATAESACPDTSSSSLHTRGYADAVDAASAASAASSYSAVHSSFGSLAHSSILKAFSSAVSLDSIEDSNQPLCSVCLGSYKEGQLVTTLSCGHAYHRDCIYPWLLQQGRQATCPMCKAQVFAQRS